MTSWWHGGIGYEIYPRSFADSNNDGIGDINGIKGRLPYLSWLGIDAIWIAPFYQSPGLDHGYDVSDYRAINPIHGTLDDFDELVADAHARDIRVIVDIVPNHSSSEHRWFQQALQGRDNPYHNYYIWRDPAPDGGPPNNWVSHFGGPAWTLDTASGQYYCHLFLPEQPDLNWHNPALREEFDDILRFWCDRGADGFRIDVAHGLIKDAQFRDNPQRVPIQDPDNPTEVFNAFEHLYDMDQDGTVDVYRRWNQVVEPYEAVLIGESNPRSLDRVARYVRGDSLHTVFYLEPGWMHWKPADLLDKLEIVHRSTDTGISWVIDNHDNPRSATRFGGGDVGRARSLAVMTFMMALGGFPFFWEGQELGLTDAAVDAGNLEDPIATRNEHGVGRDTTRTVMPWDSSHANGFSESAEPWLPSAQRDPGETVAVQRNDRSSWLSKHRDLIKVRRAHPDLWSATPQWLETPPGAVRALRRGSMLALANWKPDRFAIDLPPGVWTIVYHSASADIGDVSGTFDMAPESTYLMVAST
jgi:alpha-glucosidase